jgi:hypothetical protein
MAHMNVTNLLVLWIFVRVASPTLDRFELTYNLGCLQHVGFSNATTVMALNAGYI